MSLSHVWSFHWSTALPREEHPYAVYVHCFAHKLNLVLNGACDLSEITATLQTVSDICTCFGSSPKRTNQLKNAIEKHCPEARHFKLKKYCATRWVERHDAIMFFHALYMAIVNVLSENAELNLFNAVTSSSFLVGLHLIKEVFSVTKALSKSLQSKDLDFINAIIHVQDVETMFNNWRSGDKSSQFVSAYAEASNF